MALDPLLTNEELSAQVERTAVNEADITGIQNSSGNWFKIYFSTIKTWITDFITEELNSGPAKSSVVETDIIPIQPDGGGEWYKITFATIKTWITDVIQPTLKIFFEGIANTVDDPGTPIKNELHTPIKRGLYSNFGSKTIYQGEIAQLNYDKDTTTWSKEILALNGEMNSIADPFFTNTNPSTLLPYGWTSTGTDVYSVSNGEIELISDFEDGRLVYGLSDIPFQENGDFFRLYLELYIPSGFSGGNPSFRMWNTTTSGGFYQPGNIFTDDITEGWHILYFTGYMADIPVSEEITDIRIDVFVKEVGAKIRRPWLSFNRHTQPLDHYINQGNRAFNKKLVTLGGSITHTAQWQGELIRNISAYWSVDETRDGVDGYAPMGVSRSTVVPLTRFWTTSDPEGVKGELAFDHFGAPIYELDMVTQKHWFLGNGPDDSLFVRSTDIVYYNPNLIIVFGGRNDGLQTSGDLNDLPYNGGDAENGNDWFLPSEAGLPTFVSSYKGMLKKIVTENQLAQVYCLPMMYIGSTPLTPAEVDEYRANRDLIKAMAEEFGCEFIDLLQVGISPYNSANYYTDGIHPNLAGGKLMANYMAKHIK